MSDAVTVAGHGIHGGRPCTVRLHARPGPVRLRCAGREAAPTVDAVVGTRACTVLGGDGVRFATVEHLLGALHVRGVWSGLLIETDAEELPILDGSAAPWDEALAELGPFPAPPPARAYDGEARAEGGARASLRGGGPRALVCRIAYDHPALRRGAWNGGAERWPELLDARTFGFARDEAALRAAGLARGATSANAIVYDEDGPRTPLRGEDEPARHKALDALGDLYLLGRPFDGTLTVDRAGHALHHLLMTRLHPTPALPESAP